MPNPILDKNLLALLRVDEVLTGVLVEHGGGDIPALETHSLGGEVLADEKSLHIAGFIQPDEVFRFCDEGRSLILYCERIAELVAYLGKADFRRYLFSESLQFKIGTWRFALCEDKSATLHCTSAYTRQANWARRMMQNTAKDAVLFADGGLFVDDVGEAFADLGYCPILVDVKDLPAQLWPTSDALSSVKYVCSINDRFGVEVLAQSLNARCLIWQIDPDLHEDRRVFPSDLFMGWYKPLEKAESNRRYLPLAANVKRRTPRSERPTRVSFVGSSMQDTGERYYRHFVDYLEERGTERNDIQRRISTFFEDLCNGVRKYSRLAVLQEFPELKDGLKSDTAGGLGVDTTIWIGEYLAWKWRVHLIKNLPVPIDLWGDDGWAEISAPNVKFHGRCGHGEALSRVYGESIVNLDIGRIYQEEIVTMRVFDVLASKRFIVTPHTPAVADLFEVGREIVTYHSLDDLKEKVEYYVTNPEEALEIAERGYRRVQRDHQIVQRVSALLSWSHED